MFDATWHLFSNDDIAEYRIKIQERYKTPSYKYTKKTNKIECIEIKKEKSKCEECGCILNSYNTRKNCYMHSFRNLFKKCE